MKYDNEEKIEQYVDNACNCQEVQRTTCVADRAENSRAEVIEHLERHTCKEYLHIENRKVDNVIRRAHESQHRTGCKKTDKNEDKTAEKGCDYRSIYSFLN